MRQTRPYLFYDTVTSVCSTCLRRIEGKLVFRDGHVVLDKRCPVHGAERVLISDDVDYYRQCREVWIKPPELPERFSTPVTWGCPYDCGLCPEHMQHSCLSVIEIADLCNLQCPVCYAESGPHRPGYRSLETVIAMLDGVVAAEGEADVVQISGGEPTLHPDLFAILDAAKARPIRHLMLNTNGVRLAKEAGFAKRLATYAPGFEVYLQFDSLREGPQRALRGEDLRDIRRRALDALDEAVLSTTLVVTVQKGLNDDELGAIVDFALGRPCVRGVTFQPVQHAGRADGYDPLTGRITISEVRRRLAEQQNTFKLQDIVPVPCNPDCLAMAYAVKGEGRTVPLTGLVDPSVLIGGAANTIVLEKDASVRAEVLRLFSTAHSPESAACSLSELLCCLPRVQAPAEIRYGNVFRIIIMQFIDAHSFDLRAVKKSCVHMAQPDGTMIPFDTYNIFYRDGRRAQLDQLRRDVDAGFGLTSRVPTSAPP